ncbi:uncharacterized protein PG986_002301 [Apiospora aurea]|uniref:Uncharacterized protein n=1 Tax=Apiospora aurea TaxID=335848 RepID=A0ABR1QZH9_9PEZI
MVQSATVPLEDRTVDQKADRKKFFGRFRSELDLGLDDEGEMDGDLELHAHLGCEVEGLLATLSGFLALIQIGPQRKDLLLLLVDVADELQQSALGILQPFGNLSTHVSMLRSSEKPRMTRGFLR